MNVLIVNPAHPRTPHISAMRAWRFAQELAGLGDRVALLTADAPGGPDDDHRHAADDPVVVAVSPESRRGRSTAERVLTGQPRTAWNLFWHGGSMVDWVSACREQVDAARLGFEPDVIWSTFGRLESVLLARSLARRFRCPWVLDIKDNWELYIPRGLRRIMAWRTRGWSRVTANARFTAEKARFWQRTGAEIVYSGVDESFFPPARASTDGLEVFAVNVVGSVYAESRLELLLAGIGRWADSLDATARSRVLVRYMGPDSVRFSDASRSLAQSVCVRVEGYLDLRQMASACRSARVNAYVKHDGTFHHKLLELLCCAVPVLVVPAESEESRGLAEVVGGVLHECPDATSVAAALGSCAALGTGCVGDATRVREYSWPSQALRLRAVLGSSVSQAKGTNS